MKNLSSITRLFLAVAGLASLHSAALRAASEREIDVVAVAERPGGAAQAQTERPSAPTYYVLHDAGYIEAGDPVAGERPPTTSEVRAAAQQVLSEHGYQPAAAGQAPAVLFITHWGVVRPQTLTPRVTTRLHPNYRARLSLITPYSLFERVESALVTLEHGMPAPDLQRVEYRDALQLAEDSRFFFILSAYDFAALERGEKKPLWRVKLSTQSTSAQMNRAIPALIAASGEHFGQNRSRWEHSKTALLPMEKTSPAAEAPLNAALGSGQVETLLRELVRAEQDVFAAQSSSTDDQDLWSKAR